MTTPEEKAREILKSEPLSDHDRDMLAPKIAKALLEYGDAKLEEAAKVAEKDYGIYLQMQANSVSCPGGECHCVQNLHSYEDKAIAARRIANQIRALKMREGEK